METKKSYLKQIKGLTFAAKGDSNHWITMDGPEKVGGNDAGARPKELLLMALAGCTGSDVVSILKKKRVNLSDFEINITAQQTEENPKVFTELDLEYVFYLAQILTLAYTINATAGYTVSAFSGIESFPQYRGVIESIVSGIGPCFMILFTMYFLTDSVSRLDSSIYSEYTLANLVSSSSACNF